METEPSGRNSKMRFARRFFHPYYSGQPGFDDIVVQQTLYIRVLKPTGQNNEVTERQRMRGKVMLGGGVMFCQLKTGTGFSVQRVTWSINIGMIKHVAYEGDSKDFTLSFHNSKNQLNVLFASSRKAKDWLRVIFAEARIQAQLFNNILRQLLPTPWMKLLKFVMIGGRVTSVVMNNGRSPIDALDPEERRGLNMKDEGLVMVDTCLREEIDLWAIARGDAHPDVAEACERLSIWLLTVNKREESDYWYEEAKAIRNRFTKKMSNEIGPTVNPGFQSTNFAVENIRNPPGMLKASVFLKTKQQTADIDREARTDRLLQNFKKALFSDIPNSN